METIKVEVKIDTLIDVEVDISDVIETLNNSPIAYRWNTIAKILNVVQIDLKDLDDSQRELIANYVRGLSVLFETNVQTAEQKAQAEAEMKKPLIDLLLWMHYGNCKFSIDQFEGFVSTFLAATSGDYEFCHCKDKGKAVNHIWEDWHCTYCLKPIKMN